MFSSCFIEAATDWSCLILSSFFAGGGQIFGSKACKMQRIITLDPAGFSKQLLYHTSNNKQGTLKQKFAGHSVDKVWSQLNTVRKSAEKRMKLELAQAKS